MDMIGMDMSGMDGMSGMSMDGDDDDLNDFLMQMYWAAVGAVIGAFALVNLYTKVLAWQRCRSNSLTKARPGTLPALTIATFTAIVREIANAPAYHFEWKGQKVFGPTIGRVSMVLVYTTALVVFVFYALNPSDIWVWESIGYRSGHMSVCQLPLLFLLAGKKNIIGALIGSSYERINWLHRWAARGLLLTTTIHMGFWFSDWNRYDWISTMVRTDMTTKRGLGAWVVLAWIVFSSFAPIRGWCYEFFVIQHVLSFTAFTALVYLHVPDDVRIFIWICVGVFFFDRLLRAGSYMYNNLFKFHSHANSTGNHRDLWGSRAEMTALSGGFTKITIDHPPTKWKPGQHVFLTCHALAPLQAHPFTVSSIPSDGKMEFILQSRTGGTKRIYGHASKLLPEVRADLTLRKHVAIEGPYGTIRPLEQFDSVVFFAGSTGSTFTVPLFRDIVRKWSSEKERFVTRRIKFVWVVKSGHQLEWFREQFNRAVEAVQQARSAGHDVQLSISLYVTCDDDFTTKYGTSTGNVRKSFSEPAGVVACTDSVSEASSVNFKEKDMARVEEIEEKPAKSAGHADCCCRGEVDEDDPDAEEVVCTCACCGIAPVDGGEGSSTAGSDMKKTDKQTTTSLLHPDIHVYTGRPKIRDILRTSLEQALGESGVVVCGPQGLINDVRLATVSLSDERAVHKGTGAQGIWLHTEGFGY